MGPNFNSYWDSPVHLLQVELTWGLHSVPATLCSIISLNPYNTPLDTWDSHFRDEDPEALKRWIIFLSHTIMCDGARIYRQGAWLQSLDNVANHVSCLSIFHFSSFDFHSLMDLGRVVDDQVHFPPCCLVRGDGFQAPSMPDRKISFLNDIFMRYRILSWQFF